MPTPVHKTFASFANLCLEENATPFFLAHSNGYIGDLQFHEFFFQQSQREPIIFRDYKFRDYNHFHFSQKVNEDLQGLVAKEIINPPKQNPRAITPEGIERLTDLYKGLGEEAGIYDIIGSEFFHKFACDFFGNQGRYTKILSSRTER